MGACILCGKSAGLFNSLHKSCFSKYTASEQIIAGHLLEGLDGVEPALLANTIKNEIASYQFSVEAQQRTLNRSLEFFSKQHLNRNDASFDALSWMAVLNELAPNESLFVNKHFIAQQQNLSVRQALESQQLPESNCNPANFSISLRDNEELWWCFHNASVEQLKPVDNTHQWSVVMQLIESVLPKKNKQSLARENSGEGKLLITNQRVCFEIDDENIFTDYQDIYSCTPVSEGIRLQSRELSAMPHAYHCEDGRLLYGFIKYAQDKRSTE